MIHTFIGDLILQDLEKYSEEPFNQIKNILNNSKLIINLESPFVDDSCEIALKDKVTLFQKEENIKYIQELEPYLVSLSNNHINDYGNNSVDLTKKILNNHNIDSFGVGKKSDTSHIKIDEKDKIIFISYTTRETDLTGEYLFADYNMNGPKDIDFDEIKSLKKKYQGFKIVLYLHWGVEYIPLPMPQQRILSYKLIDIGVDLIVGHHAHIIQPYEIYKNKYIFYSLGNFLFPDIEFFLNGKKVKMEQVAFMKEGLICKFDIHNNRLEKLYKICRDENCNISLNGKYNQQLKESNNIIYKIKYVMYKYKLKLKEFIPLIPRIPQKLKKIFYANLSDYWYTKIRFIKSHCYLPNLKNPKSFSEKINHIKLYKINELREKIVDRIWIRDYVLQKAPECKLIQNLWVGTNFTKNDWDNLPQEFVIKGNHGSGMVKVVDKKRNSFLEILDLTKVWMKTDYSEQGREWFYNKVENSIIVEEKLTFNGNVPPDFKFFCLNNKVEMVQVDSNRFVKHTRNLYDRKFNELNVMLQYPVGLSNDKPLLFDKAILIAEKLSQSFDFIRVDLYILEDNIFFGELTNIPGNGIEKFKPKNFDFKLGRKLKLNE